MIYLLGGQLKHLRTEMSPGIRHQSRGHTGQTEGGSFLAPGDTLNSVEITVVQWGKGEKEMGAQGNTVNLQGSGWPRAF